MSSKVDIARLNVSLTKHGAHKLAPLLRRFGKDEVLGHVHDRALTISIDAGQARKNLSAGRHGKVPQLWDYVRALGGRAIDALVLMAIVFSHHELIAAMAQGRKGIFGGRISRGQVLDGKAYTNFAHTLEELGFSLSHTPDEVIYDLRPLFSIQGLNPLALELLKLKLKDAGWNGSTDPVDEMVANGFHESLSISSHRFKAWLTLGTVEVITDSPKDTAFVSGTDEEPVDHGFKFRAGHDPKKTGTILLRAPPEQRTAVLRHNEIQTALYEQLATKHGRKSVGTEVATGMGTSIDVVVRLNGKCHFYEIKVADTLRACLRQAIPQLLEYAYWRCDDNTAEKLIIVGTFALDAKSNAYLTYLRDRFKLPIFYEQFVD